MEVIKIKYNEVLKLDPCVMAIGFFDGFHIGHQKLIEETIKIASTKNIKKGIITFSNQANSIISKKSPKFLMSLDEKINYINNYDFDYFVILEFDEMFSKMEYNHFIDKYIIDSNIKEVVCGFDFRFGYKGKGNVSLLQNYSSAYTVSVIQKQTIYNKRVSSTLIRELITLGKLEDVKNMLKRNYSISGIVIHGKKLGRKMGFPTANVDYTNHVIPKKGVYGGYAYYQGTKYVCMINVGYNPTVSNLNKPSLEVSIFDFDKDIYDEILNVEFVYYVREEQKFNGIDELKDQLKRDRLSISNHIK
ncbi:MAG: bifunctional riboflavin kinase/FAD synthetase [Thomasclavelia sp.]|nr:bifunctional riboflavin kinase/FAD synthetase [Thomasclavelia sp.]